MPISSRRSAREETLFQSDPSRDNTSDISFIELAEPGPEIASGTNTLSAHDINLHVKLPKRFWQKDKKLQILSNITGVFTPGVNAILGNFGAGKTSLLNVLAGRVDPMLVDGTILLNGHLIPENFKTLVGFVPQYDTLQGSLTVRENIAFSSSLRLPTCLTKSERDERINYVLKELDLENCADIKIGTSCIRGVTPGTKKLCSIGMELVISPPVLFLDEPTTFLDPLTANFIILCLKRLSCQGRTVIFSVTQPRYSAYQRFDNIMLLSSGNTIFQGTPKDATAFFEQQGFKCQKRNNPADFFMEVINADQTSILDYCRRANPQRHSPENSTGDPQNVFNDRFLIQDALIKGFASSKWCTSLLEKASDIYARFQSRQRMSAASIHHGINSSQTSPQRIEGYSTSVLNQLLVVSMRAIRNLIRNPEMGIKTIFTTMFFSTILVGIYWQLEKDPETGFSDRAGVLFFVVLMQLFFNISSLEKYYTERLTFLQENRSGFYRVSVYFFVKIFFDILPLRIIVVVLMSTIVYFAVGLRNDSASFFLFVLCLFLVTTTAAGISFLVASTFGTFAQGQMLMSLVYMMMLLFSGYMINLGSLGVWISWMQYTSIIKYSLTALYINEFQDRIFCNADNTTCQTGNSYLSQNDMDFGSGWDLWQNYFALILVSLALFGLSYVQLRRMAASF